MTASLLRLAPARAAQAFTVTTEAIRRVGIVGGGIGGLTAALALRKRGFDAQVYERAHSFQTAGAGIILAPNAMGVLHHLGLEEPVRARGHMLEHIGICDQSGQRLSTIPLRELAARNHLLQSHAIHRADLHDALRSQLPDDALHLGHKLLAFQQDAGSIALEFEGKPAASVDLLIGADGLHSRVRDLLFGASPLRYSGQTCWRGLCPTAAIGDAGNPPGDFFESWGAGSRFGYVDVGNGKTYWYATAQWAAGEITAPERGKERLHALFAPWHPPIQQMIDATPLDALLHHDLYDRAPKAGWSQGSVTLLGDSIHPTTPSLGQGAAMAIESAATLARHLSLPGDLADVLRRYEDARYVRTAEVTRDSKLIGKVSVWHNPLLRWVRNAGMRMAPEKQKQSNLLKLFDYKVD